ncbi:MAG TPA: hypothetical protein VGK73_14130 [Polyangiaceae bacterium]
MTPTLLPVSAMILRRNTPLSPRAFPLCLTLAALACSVEDNSPPGGAAGGGATCDALDGRFTITDDTNYTLPSSLEVAQTTLKDDTDLVFDWSALTRDFYGKPLDAAADIDLILLSLWRLTPEELRSRLEADDLPLGFNIGAITAYPDGTSTSANLLSFNLQGNPIPEEELWAYFDTQAEGYQYPQDSYTFLAMASSGTVIGRNARMLQLFTLDPASDHTALTFTDDSTELEFEARLGGARALRVPVGTPAISVDWSQMKTTSLGNEYLPSQITRAAVAHFATSDLAELEADFLDLRELADGWWESKVEKGTSIDLGTFVDESGTAFPGIDDQGTWLVALFCTSRCNNPAPWSITILRPCD